MGKVLHEVCDITVECIVTPESGSNRLKQAIGNVGAVAGAFARQLREMTPREATRAITKNVVKALITKKCVGVLHLFYKNSHTKLIKLAKKIKQSAQPMPVPVFAGCPEGYFANESADRLFLFQKSKNNKIESVKKAVAASTKKNKQLPQKIVQETFSNVKPLKVHNMKQFFNEFEFGKLLKKHSIKTSMQYNGQSIYRVNETINKRFKKGYYYYLDSPHYDHLEVFNMHGIAESVVNLDGAENVKKTLQAAKQARTIW